MHSLLDVKLLSVNTWDVKLYVQILMKFLYYHLLQIGLNKLKQLPEVLYIKKLMLKISQYS